MQTPSHLVWYLPIQQPVDHYGVGRKLLGILQFRPSLSLILLHMIAT